MLFKNTILLFFFPGFWGMTYKLKNTYVQDIQYDILMCIWSVKVKVTQLCPTLCDLMDYTVHGILQARILEWVPCPFSRGFSQPRDQTQVTRIAGGFFTSWATGKPKDTGVGSLSLLQGVFPTQEWNRGLLHYRQILYQLRYEGSLNICKTSQSG